MTGEEEGERGKTLEAMSSEPVSIFPQEWIHVAATFDEGMLRFFINGHPAGKLIELPCKTIPSVTQQYSSILAISGLEEGSRVDDFAFFGNRALSEDEIANLYENGLENFDKSSH